MTNLNEWELRAVQYAESISSLLEHESLTASKKALENLIERKKANGVVDEVLCRVVRMTFIYDLTKRQPEHAKALSNFTNYCQLLLSKSNYKVCRKRRNWNKSIEHERLSENEEKILNGLNNPFLTYEVAVYLIGAAIIIRYETDTQILRQFISRYLGLYKCEDWEIELAIQTVFTLDEKFHNAPRFNRSHKSEAFHIRNAFAHSHVRFLPNGGVELWDHSKGVDGRYLETYREAFTPDELLTFLKKFGIRINAGMLFFHYFDAVFFLSQTWES